MKCPYCFSVKMKVIDSRATNDSTIRRRRICTNCSKRFTTYESINVAPLIVIKNNGNMEPYNKEKIKKSLINVCHKRSISEFDIEKTVTAINDEIIKIDVNEISSKNIKEIVESHLKELDNIAFDRYISAYK